jgi:hypothetical protein
VTKCHVRRVRCVNLKVHTFLTSQLDLGERSVLRLGHFGSGVRTPDTHWIGDYWLLNRPELGGGIQTPVTRIAVHFTNTRR